MDEKRVDEMESKISFFQGKKDIGGDSPLDAIQQKLSELSSVKNINFLLGAGASADAIPSMVAMHEDIREEIKKATKADLSENNKKLYGDISTSNLEEVLSILYAKKTYLSGISEEEEKNDINLLIKFIENKIFSKINIDLYDSQAEKSLSLYKRLYQKTALRNKDLARINVFTTNNDLFNEKALDNLNINFNNGFGGGLDRFFNPARFHYTFSKKIDINLEKFEPLENMVYLYKLHGSISWIEEEGNSLFNIREIPVAGGTSNDADNHVLIFPTPLKQSQSLGSPYSDLIREFQTKISQPNTVILIIGYSFSDDHINNIIYQALASNSSISVVIFGEFKECPLVKINDNRIYQIFGTVEDEKIHYFDYIVNNLLPDLDENTEQILIDDFITALKSAEKRGD